MRPSPMLVFVAVCFWLPLLAGCGGGSSEDPAVASAGTPPAGDAAESSPGSPGGSVAGEEGGGDGAEPRATSEPGSESGEDSGSASNPNMDEASSPVSEDSGESSSGEQPDTEGGDAVAYDAEMQSSEGDAPESSDEEGYSSDGSGSEGYPGPTYGSGGPGTAPAKPATFADTAQQMFRQGNDQQAFRYLNGHAVAADSAAAKELLDKMGFSPQLARPVWAIRWGIGIEYNGPQSYSGNFFPIGTVQEMPLRPSARAAGGDGGGFDPTASADGMETSGRSRVDPVLQKVTGELGQKVVEQLSLRLGRGDYGQVYDAATASGGRAGAGSGYSSGGSGYEDESGYGNGGYGTGGHHAGTPATGGRDRALRSMVPGLAMLGVGPTKELLATARQAGLHAVVVFKVAVALNPKAKLVFTDTDLYLYDAANNKELFRTRKPLRNTEVQRHRAEGEDDGVAKMLVALFATVDQTWRLAPLPELDPPKVLDRVRVLLGQKSDEELLPALAEIRMYHTRGLLQDAHLLIAYQKLLGEEVGGQLAAGSEEEKKQIVQAWLTPAPPKAGPRDILQQTGS